MKPFTFFVSVFVAQLAFLTVPAFATRDVMMVDLRKPQERAVASATTRFEGTLLCKVAAVNDGEPCALKLKEAKTGRLYSIANSDDAMKYFSTGTREVAIDGSIVDGNTINVAKVSAR